MTAVLSFFAGSKIARYVLIAVLAVAGVALVLMRVRAAGEKAGALAEALATSETSNEAKERMNAALATSPRGRRATADRLRDGRG